MKKIYIKARAKINLNLIVLNKRHDNYHNIKSVFQKINLYDEIYINKNDTNEFNIKTNIEQLNNEENIIYKAYKEMKQKYDITGIDVILNKKIPMQAGLAGGSTDCASFILGINKLFDLKLTKNEIEKLGKDLGADVVPCLYNKAVIAQGIGDKIIPIDTSFKYYILIIKPKASNNTKEMYMKIDLEENLSQLDNTEKIKKALRENNIELLADNLYNVFENVVSEKQMLKEVKHDLTENGALGSIMTGSGSCIYGIFKNKEIAKKAYNTLKNKYKIYICISQNSRRGELF